MPSGISDMFKVGDKVKLAPNADRDFKIQSENRDGIIKAFLFDHHLVFHFDSFFHFIRRSIQFDEYVGPSDPPCGHVPGLYWRRRIWFDEAVQLPVWQPKKQGRSAKEK